MNKASERETEGCERCGQEIEDPEEFGERCEVCVYICEVEADRDSLRARVERLRGILGVIRCTQDTKNIYDYIEKALAEDDSAAKEKA